MSVIEAMLTALPVIATDIRGPREQVLDGVTGLLACRVGGAFGGRTEPAGGRSFGLRAAMGAAGRARAIELYDEATVLARTMELLGLDDRNRLT